MAKNFNFSEKTLENAQDKLIKRLVDAMSNDSDVAEDIVRYGYKGIEDLDGAELLEEYESWHGYYDEGDGVDDQVYQSMLREKADLVFEEEVLEVNETLPLIEEG